MCYSCIYYCLQFYFIFVLTVLEILGVNVQCYIVVILDQ